MENNENEMPKKPETGNRPIRKTNTEHKDRQPYPKDPDETWDLPQKPKPDIGENDGKIKTPFDKNNNRNNEDNDENINNGDEIIDDGHKNIPETDERGNNTNETM